MGEHLSRVDDFSFLYEEYKHGMCIYLADVKNVGLCKHTSLIQRIIWCFGMTVYSNFDSRRVCILTVSSSEVGWWVYFSATQISVPMITQIIMFLL